MTKNILISALFFCLFNISFSQVLIQGFSMGYGGKGIKKSSDFELNSIETDSSVYSASYNSPDSKGSFSIFAMDYFLKLRYKKFYFKTNLGVDKFSSKTRTHYYYDIWNASNSYYIEFEKGKEYTSKVTEWYFMNGYGIDYILTKNLTIGYNFQFGIYYLFGGFKDASALNSNWYSINPVNRNFFDLTNSSFDLEYVHDIFGIKYSYIMTPGARSVHQFGVTYNLKYDWKEVAQ